MKLNADFTQRVAVHPESNPFVPSPLPGVERQMLDRIGDEVARATSIVRYKPGSSFSAHTHYGGEEYLVLEGVFQDEHGDYPEGTYVRNPPTSKHTPRSEQGATIFVKLWQFDPDDRQQITIDTNGATVMPERPGVHVIPLYEDKRERVRIEIWSSYVTLDTHQGIEILVLDGQFSESGESFSKNSWLRLPPGYPLRASTENARVWVKMDHLLAPSTTEPFLADSSSSQ